MSVAPSWSPSVAVSVTAPWTQWQWWFPGTRPPSVPDLPVPPDPFFGVPTAPSTPAAPGQNIPLVNLGSLGAVTVPKNAVITAIVIVVGLILIVIGAASFAGGRAVRGPAGGLLG